jgi:hypothetical protein
VLALHLVVEEQPLLLVPLVDGARLVVLAQLPVLAPPLVVKARLPVLAHLAVVEAQLLDLVPLVVVEAQQPVLALVVEAQRLRLSRQLFSAAMARSTP